MSYLPGSAKKERDARIFALHKAGLSATILADRFGLDRGTIGGILRAQAQTEEAPRRGAVHD